MFSPAAQPQIQEQVETDGADGAEKVGQMDSRKNNYGDLRNTTKSIETIKTRNCVSRMSKIGHILWTSISMRLIIG